MYVLPCQPETNAVAGIVSAWREHRENPSAVSEAVVAENMALWERLIASSAEECAS